MDNRFWSAFNDEIEKMAAFSDYVGKKPMDKNIKNIKKGVKEMKGKDSPLPWAIARGVTGAGAGAIFGLPTAKAMGLKGRTLAKFLAATAGTGLGVSFAKGLSEKAIERSVAKAMKIKKKDK